MRALLLIAAAAAFGCAPPPSTPSATGPARPIDGNAIRFGAGRLTLPGVAPNGVGANLGDTNAPGSDWTLDWKYLLSAPESVTPALVIHGTSADPADRFIGAGNVQGGEYLGAASNIYCTGGNNCPTIAWFIAVDSPINSGAIALSVDGSTVYAVSSAGRLYAVDVATGNLLDTPASSSTGAAVSNAAPWLDFQSSPQALYVGDTNGGMTKFRLDTYAVAWHHGITGCKAVHSSPVAWNGVVWVGCDDGALHRLDPATGNELGSPTVLCANAASCGTNDQLWGPIFIDAQNNRLLLGANNRVIAIDVGATTGCTAASSTCAFSATTVGTSARFYSMPFADDTGGWIYVAFNNKLWRASYSGATGITSGFSQSVALKGAKAGDAGYPKSAPLVFNGHVWIADGGGYVNRYNAATMAFENVTIQYGTEIDSTPLIDFVNGNIYYATVGADSGNGKITASIGSWVQLIQNW